ncbi:DUF4397 domain-containing protein [Streptomyces meridianus]|uniref:DUF4397 domain-containing protein n=1 Tax=Streptomyces meridianus TaxID=2938945 RepID=A0ABT0X1E1_9ACTN|nr:DUF4397 domain-containing protein [Streptomyces meridianus]MCM2576299.1 DUF4397 domain-containing protein [Streptomyces meridianus]
MRYSRSATAVAAGLGTLALALSAAAPAVAESTQAEAEKADVSVFHAVPGLTVDVYANGKKLLPDFKPGTLTAPQPLASGSYDIKVFKAGADPQGKPAIEKQVEIPAGANATLVAHLTADGSPTLDAYVNDTSKVAQGKARLTVRHVAAAPAVDVRADGTPVFKGLVNPKEATAEVPAGSINADVVLAGTADVVIGPAELNLKAGTSTVVYAWGSAQDKNLALKVQNLGTGQTPPGVSGGEGDAMADRGNAVTWAAWGALGTAALAGALVVRRRSAQRD